MTLAIPAVRQGHRQEPNFVLTAETGLWLTAARLLELMRRVFAIDVLECPACGGRMRILCTIHPPEAIRKILDCLGPPSRPPPTASAALDADVDQLQIS